MIDGSWNLPIPYYMSHINFYRHCTVVIFCMNVGICLMYNTCAPIMNCFVEYVCKTKSCLIKAYMSSLPLSGMPVVCAGSDDVDEVSGYDETSIRYRGRNIPSKSFRMLQSMTGSGSDEPGRLSHATGYCR